MNLQELLAREIAKKTGKTDEKKTERKRDVGESLSSDDLRELEEVVLRETQKYSSHKISVADLQFLQEPEGRSPAREAAVAMKCNLYIHDILERWTQECANNNESSSSELLAQSKRDLLPLLVQLRKHLLSHELLVSLCTILYHLQQAQWSLALQSYMQLSIGNVAWPIGVTQIGIHERAAHSKIAGREKVANVVRDDCTRRWITAVKRLATFVETQPN